MIEKIKKTSLEFHQCQDIETWLKLFSVLTWNKIGFARSRDRLKIYETTITQELLFNFRLFAEATPIPIEIFEASSEKTNGNDFEILIEVEQGYILLPCQAKIIWSGDKYQAITHTVGNEFQINLLVNYAEKKGGFPIYMLYNFCENYQLQYEIRNKIDFDIEEYGCSLVPAIFVKENFYNKRTDKYGKLQWKVPTFEDLHPVAATPFYHICKLIGNLNYLTSLLKNTNIQNNIIKIYTREELIEDDNWIDLVPIPHLGKIENPFQKFNISANSALIRQEFSPKFRFILSKEKIKKGTRISTLR